MGAHFLDPAGGPKFEVTSALVLTLFSCFKKMHLPLSVVEKIRISSRNDSIYDQDTLEVETIVNPSDKWNDVD